MKLTPEQAALIRKYALQYPTIELVKIIAKETGLPITTQQIASYKCKHKLHNPDLKYKKQGRLRRPGDADYHPIGSEKTRHLNGVNVTLVKVAQPGLWRVKQHVIWEAHHQKPFPKGYVIVYKDGNNESMDVNNMLAVPREVMLAMNTYRLRSNIPEHVDTEVLLAKINVALYQKSKARKERKERVRHKVVAPLHPKEE